MHVFSTCVSKRTFSTHTLCDSRFLCAASDVCTQKTIYIRTLNYGFKTHDFNAIDVIIKIKQMFFLAEIWDTICNGTALFWKRGLGVAAHLHLKRRAQKQSVSNGHFQNNIINDLWSILSWNFRHILGTPETCITSCKCSIIGAF